MRRSHFYWVKVHAVTRANFFEHGMLTLHADNGQSTSAHSFEESPERTLLG